ncbi:MAG TPA: hypothetical protein IAC65_04175 [Candidatus Aphodousia faecipullorum]|nr:hypothetical protein [Candidatus Aphodousia faecipullorum]
MSTCDKSQEKVTVGCYISLALAILFFSGVCASASHWWGICDYMTLMGKAGRVVTGVVETTDGLATTTGSFRGAGGTGALDGFMFGISSILPGVMLVMGMINIFEHYGALRAARQLLTPLMRFLIGVRGSAALALIACLQSTDGGAAMTRKLKDEGELTEVEVNNFATFQMVASAPITNFVTTGAAFFALTAANGEPAMLTSIGFGLVVLLVAKVLGANLMRLIQLRASRTVNVRESQMAKAPVLVKD